MNHATLMEFLGRVTADMGATGSAGLVVIGNRLGLYRALAQGPALLRVLREDAKDGEGHRHDQRSEDEPREPEDLDPAEEGREREQRRHCPVPTHEARAKRVFFRSRLPVSSAATSRSSSFQKTMRLACSPFLTWA